MIGGLIMTHGDDSGPHPPAARGAVPGGDRPIPPRKGDVNEAVLPKAREVAGRAARGRHPRAPRRPRHAAPGFKYADWEMRGVPLRLELGPKDLEKDQCVLVRRDNREKSFVPLAGLAAAVREKLDALQNDLLERARKFVADNTTHVADLRTSSSR
jgi:prolyl-tRNA synthetase